ncbi:MAG: hypothetical protein U0840_12030 [Gemmataceae bacterium]
MRTSLVLITMVLCPLVSQAQQTPQAIIEKAIEAHGGKARLAGFRSERVKLKGTLHVGSKPLPFTNEQAVQLPGQYRSTVTLDDGMKSHSIVHLLDGEKAAILLDGQPQEVQGPQLAQLKQTLQLEEALRLVPLISNPEFKLQLLPEVRYNNLVFTGIRVTGKGQRDLKLFFDGASGLLVKTEHRLDGPSGKDVIQEAFYADYRNLNGHLRAGKVVVLRDGKKVMEAELVTAQRVERIDPIEFSRP